MPPLTEHPRKACRAEGVGPFVGRRSERARTRDLLGEHRLVTIAGPGGSGKTRLAIAVLDDLADAYPAGACFVDASGLDRRSQLLPAVAGAVGLPRRTSPSLDAVAAALAEGPRLLVLDNLEQVRAAGVRVAELLGAAPTLRVLATSRSPLHVPGEHVLLLEPFAVPADGEADPAVLADVESVAFLLVRVRALAPSFELGAGNAADVAAICRHLDGLPLALELVAPHVRTLGPAEVARYLAAGVPPPRAVAAGTPGRQSTMAATIAWSEALVSPAARRILAHLAVFAGPFRYDAACAVCAEGPSPRAAVGRHDPPRAGAPDDGTATASGPAGVAAALDELVDASLLAVRTDADGVPAYRLAPVIREHVRERLPARSRTILRRRHAAWFERVALQGEAGLAGPDTAHWFRRLGEEMPDIEAALAQALAHGDASTAQRIAAALERYWLRTGRLHLALDRLRAACALDPTAVTGARLAALVALARFTFEVEPPAAADAIAEEAQRLADALGDERGRVRAASMRGLVAMREGRLGAAIERFDALDASLADPDDPLRAIVCGNRSTALALAGRVAEAEADRAEAIRLCRAAGDLVAVGTLLTSTGLFRGMAGDAIAAIPPLREGVELLERCGATADATWGLLRLAGIEARLGRVGEARALALVALPRALAEGDELKLTNALATAFELALAEGRVGDAEALWPVTIAAHRAHGILQHAPGFEEDLAHRLTAAARTSTAGRRLAVAGVPVDQRALAAAVEASLRAVAAEPRAAGRPAGGRPAGGRWDLTPREREVAALLRRGCSDAEIGRRLGMSPKTASVHVANIKGKLGVSSRTAAALATADVDADVGATAPGKPPGEPPGRRPAEPPGRSARR